MSLGRLRGGSRWRSSLDHRGRQGDIRLTRMNRIWRKIRIFRIVRIF
jgi:hypothetical protein